MVKLFNNFNIYSINMLYYRRKLILALLGQFGGRLNDYDLHNLLFLFTIEQDEPQFDFVPFEAGAFSFQVEKDLDTLRKNEYVGGNNDKWNLNSSEDFAAQLNSKDKAALKDIYDNFYSLNGSELSRYVFENYRYYGINSDNAENPVDGEQLRKIHAERNTNKERTLFTIGYEGLSIDAYINKLIRNNVKALVDVRNNPNSRKFGFSKKQLNYALDKMGMDYYHFPELGISKEKRKNLKSKEEYQKLFEQFENETLKNEWESLMKVYELLEKEGRIALTCYEADHEDCHRSRVAKAVKEMDEKVRVEHV